MEALLNLAGKLAERYAANISPMLATVLFFYMYDELRPDTPQYELLSWTLCGCLIASGLATVTRMFFGWPKVPLVDTDRNQ